MYEKEPDVRGPLIAVAVIVATIMTIMWFTIGEDNHPIMAGHSVGEPAHTTTGTTVTPSS